LRRGNRGLTQWAIFIEPRQFLLKGLVKEFGAMLPQEHKQLGPSDPLDDGLLVC